MSRRSSSRSSKSSGGGGRRKKSSLLMQILTFIGALIVVALGAFFGVDELSNTITDEEAPVKGDWYEVYFTSPVEGNDPSVFHNSTAEQALIRRINAAKTSIDAALFEIDSPDVTQALVNAVRRGVRVRLVLDDEHALEDPSTTVQQIIDAGAEYVSDERSALMHNKYLIIDGTYVWTGATNLTRNGIYKNDNNAILIRSPKVVQNFQEDFEEMFLDGNFSRRADSRGVPNRSFSIDGTQIETYFSPDDAPEIETRLVDLIESSQSSIYVMTFVMTLDSMGNAILERYQDGVRVEAVFENTGSVATQSEMPRWGCAGAPVRQDSNPTFMHHKVIILDEKIVVLGSFNFSESAKDNSENILIIHNVDIAKAYVNEFRRVFDAGSEPTRTEMKCS
jgi:phosphatidylserine/phosphatidylglycerophosphate/cardiolipin synthase-like enzyme